MIWQNPWALLGLFALAVPVVIHFLGRRSARIRRFPTLRFVGTARLMATRWTKPSDLALLAVRAGIVAAAAAALAQPLLLTADRSGNRERSVARAIIVDTSPSMRRSARAGTPEAPRAVDVARFEAQRVVADARTSVFIHTAAPAHALAGAVGWLGTQRGRREIVLVSDFQVGTVDAADLRAVPAAIGVQLIRVDVESPVSPLTLATRQDSAAITATIAVDSVSTRVEWTSDDSAAGPILDGIVSVAGDGELAHANASRRAAMVATATLVADGRYPVTLVHRESESRAELLNAASPLSAPWHGDVVARLRADPMLAAAASAVADGDSVVLAESGFAPAATGSPLVVLARSPSGRPIAFAASAKHRGLDVLVLFSETDAGSLASAALIAATLRATARPLLVEELEPSVISESTLEGWRRAASMTPASAGGDIDASDGRWLWLLALVLLGIEMWMRRERRNASLAPIARERAA